MKYYTKVYLDYFGFSKEDFIPCENCGAKAVDIHHLTPRSTRKDLINKIENLMALCRTCHIRAEKDKLFNTHLRLVHRKALLKSKHDSGEIVRGIQSPKLPQEKACCRKISSVTKSKICRRF